MSRCRNSSEDLVQVQLCSARGRILAILPVDDENAQRLERSLATRVRIEHAIHELRAGGRAVPFREAHGLLDHDARRRDSGLELGGGDAQHGALDRAEALQPPVRRELGQRRVDLSSTGEQRAHEDASEVTLLLRDFVGFFVRSLLARGSEHDETLTELTTN